MLPLVPLLNRFQRYDLDFFESCPAKTLESSVKTNSIVAEAILKINFKELTQKYPIKFTLTIRKISSGLPSRSEMHGNRPALFISISTSPRSALILSLRATIS